MNLQQVCSMNAGKDNGPRASVHEQHHGHLNKVMGHLRELGHTVTNVQHSTKTPAGFAKSVIRHKSGTNKLKTVVNTKFNSEGGDHLHKIVTGPDDEEE